MNPFRTIKINSVPARGKIVQRDFKLQSTVKDNVELTELVEFDDDYSQAPPLVRADDFTLKKQLQAGVQMNRINVSSMLNPTDPASIQVNDEASLTKDFNTIQSETIDNSTDVDPVPNDDPKPVTND